MPYASDKQRRYMHAQHPSIAKRWDKEMKKKAKISVNNKLKGAFGQMDPDTNKIQINVKKHYKKGKLDRAELASTIKHELMHVRKPKATEKEVYKATAKTKIPPQEQNQLIAKLRNKKMNYKIGSIKKKFKMKGDLKPGDMISKMNENKIIRKINRLNKVKSGVAIMGMV